MTAMGVGVIYRLYLTDIQRRLDAAIRDLREQMAIVPKITSAALHEPLRRLLHNGVLMYGRLADQRDALQARIAEFFPLDR
jgi:hypothetical protein